MIDTGTAIITGSLLSLLGAIIIIELNNKNWFSRENWKMNKAITTKEVNIRFKKLEKDMGIQKGQDIPTTTEKGFFDLIRGIDKDKIAQILNVIQGGETYEEEPGGDDIISRGVDFFQSQPPEIQQELIKKLGGVLGGQKEEIKYIGE